MERVSDGIDFELIKLAMDCTLTCWLTVIRSTLITCWEWNLLPRTIFFFCRQMESRTQIQDLVQSLYYELYTFRKGNKTYTLLLLHICKKLRLLSNYIPLAYNLISNMS